MNKINALRERLEILRNTIMERESSCVYGSPEIIQQYGQETMRLKEEAGLLEMELKELENQ